jgi:selT/selW/selH-like putative selenoprotein
LAATIKSETGVESELVCGGGGIFDVVVDGDMIFSKFELDRFPEDDEIISKIRSI